MEIANEETYKKMCLDLIDVFTRHLHNKVVDLPQIFYYITVTYLLAIQHSTKHRMNPISDLNREDIARIAHNLGKQFGDELESAGFKAFHVDPRWREKGR